jgi:regulator of sirC expression with transglutaminase-like and TPR domain
VSALKHLLVERNESIPLDVAALGVAAIEFPGLTAVPHLKQLDKIAAELDRRTSGLPGEQFVLEANGYLFDELGLKGNESDYYNPRNSCLNEVLRTRLGIPISLGLVYMEVARRINRRVLPIGLPGHFLVRYQDRDYATFMDPFHAGKLLDDEAALRLAAANTGARLSEISSAVLLPVENRTVVVRMLNNLRAIYLRSRILDKGLKVLDLLIEGSPGAGGYYFERGQVNYSLGQMRLAGEDLKKFIFLEPEAAERPQAEKLLRDIARYLANLN